MDTRNLYTSLPEKINRQIEKKTQTNNINITSVESVANDGVIPLYLSELSAPFDSKIPPATPEIRWQTYYEGGYPVVRVEIIFSGRDKLGHEMNVPVMADIYRDKNNDGVFEDDEYINSLDLKISNIFIDRDVPKDSIIRYKILLKAGNKQQTWSEPVIVSTSDNIIPAIPAVGVDPDSGLDNIVVLTDNLNSITNGDNCNAVLKIKQHNDDDFKLFEIRYRVVGQSKWEKHVDILSGAAEQDGYYYVGLKNLIRGQFYEIQVRAQRNSGSASDWSASIQFRAGDYIGPQKPENVYAINVSTDVALGLQVCWSAPAATGNTGIKYYRVYRWEYDNTTSLYVDGTKTLIGNFDTSSFPYMTTWGHIDETVVEGRYYAYEVSAISDDTDSNPSSAVWTYPDLVAYISDSPILTTSFVNRDNNFPILIDWTGYAGGYHGTYIAFRELDRDKRTLFRKDFKSSVQSYTLTLQDFAEEDARDFMDIDPMLGLNPGDVNYSIEVGAVYNATYAGTRRTRAGKDTILLNPKPANVQNFEATYDALRHQIDFKWTKNADAFLTGYEIKSITEANYLLLLATTGETEEDNLIRRTIWTNGETLANTTVLNKNIINWTWQMPIGVTPSPEAPSAYYFLIKAVGDFFIDYKYRSAELEKIIYSKESDTATTTVLQKLPAPTVDTVSYTSAVLDGKVMRMNWTITLTEAQKRQFKEFWLYMSTTATDVDSFNPTYRVWRGADLTTVLEKDHLGNALNYATTYYFRVVAVDQYDNPGNLSERFTNYPAGSLSVLPQCRITGATVIRSVPVELNSQSETPFHDSTLVDVYNTRSMQFEIPVSFTKNMYVDRIRWYVSTSGGAYTLVTETFFDKEKVNQAVTISAGFKQSYSFSTDKTLFQVKAVQYRPDGAEGSLVATTASRYSKIDTLPPAIDIQKVLYHVDGTNAINKNGYINKKITDSGIDIYFRSYEKESNSGIQKTEYTVDGATWTSCISPLNITNVMLGADTANGLYRDFEIKLRAYDNADNVIEQIIKFKKDTIGPSASDLPTSLTWAFGRDVKLSWTNPTVSNRNLYDGLKLFIGGILEDAQEYTLDSNPFIFRPALEPEEDSVELYLAAFDIADNYTYLDENGAVQSGPYKITLVNYPPAAPANLTVEQAISGVKAKWDAVTTDTNDGAEEVEKYQVSYGLGETEGGVSVWNDAGYFYSTEASITLSSSDMALCAANTNLYLFVKVRAYDYWGLDGAYCSANGARPREITAVDMEGNIFDFEVSFGGGATMTGGGSSPANAYDLVDADYDNARYVRINNTSAYNGYVQIDFKKAEWLPEIKIKLKYGIPVNFFIEYQEKTAGTVSWGHYLVPTSGHTFNTVGSITKTATKPSVSDEKYFSHNEVGPGEEYNALFTRLNFASDTRALFVQGIRVYFVTEGNIDVVEVQPIIESIANIFYGSEINLDKLVSIRSNADSINYIYLTKLGLTIYGNNGSGVSEQKVTIGYLDTNIYGAWLRDRVYIGGSSYSNAPIQIVGASASINLGGLYATPSQSYISGANGSFSTGNGLSTNYLSATASGSTMGPTDSQVSSTSAGTEIKQKVSVDTTKGWSQYNNYYIQFGVGLTYGAEVRAQLGRLAANVYGSWLTNGVYIGGTSYANCELRLTASTLEMGYISADVYNMTLTSSALSVGRTGSYYNAKFESAAISLGYHINGYAIIVGASEIKMKLPSETTYNLSITSGQIGLGYTGGYYNTKITGGAISIGHLSGGTNYALTMDYSVAEANRYFSIKGMTLVEFFRVGRVTYGAYTRDITWTNRMHLGKDYTTAMTDPGLVDSTLSIKIYDTDNLFGIGICGSAISGGSAIRINTTCPGMEIDTGSYQSITADSSYAGGTIHGVNTNANGFGVYGSHTTNTGVRGVSTSGYGVWGESTSNHGICGETDKTDSNLIAGVCGKATSAIGVYGETTTKYGVLGNATTGYGVKGESTSSYGVYGYSANATGTYGEGKLYGVYGYSSTAIGVLCGSGGETSFRSLKGAEFNSTILSASIGASTGTALILDGSGYIRTLSSSIRYKTDVIDIPIKYSVDSLHPVEFTLKETGQRNIGLIAEEVEQIYPEIVSYLNGRVESVKYTDIIPILIKEIQVLKKSLNELKIKVDSLTKTE